MNSTLTVTQAATVTALTTLQRVKAELGIADGASDSILSSKISEASSDIEAQLNRVFRRETVQETFWGAPFSINALVLERTPLGDIDSVVVDGEAVESSEWRADPEAGLLYRLTADGYEAAWCWSKSIVVTYAAGYLLPGESGATLPPVIEAAAVELVASYWSARGRDPRVRVEDIPGVMRTEYWVGAVGAAGQLPPGVFDKIAIFGRRPIIA